MAALPVWLKSDNTPPITPRAAIAAARPLLRGLVKQGDEWELERIILRRIRQEPEVWIYEVQFLSPLPPLAPDSVGSIGRSPLSLIVLMDGRALSPIKGASVAGNCRIN
jgi:hypothetical protein